MEVCKPGGRLVAAERHARAFRAIAHVARLKIVFFLVRRGEEVTTGEIRKATGLPGPTLSHHLATLRTAGVTVSRRESRFIWCSIDRAMISDLVRLLSACC